MAPIPVDDRVFTLSTAESLWDPLYMLVPMYAVAVPLLRRMYAVKKDEKVSIPGLKTFMVAYNLIMSLFSLVCFIGIAYVVIVRQHGVWKGQDCMMYNRDWLFRALVKAFHWSKYVEFLDTLFLILNGKPVSWLHYFHHCGAAINVGILEHSGIEAAFLFVGLNGFVHTIMYAYFGLSIMGIKWRAIRPWITIMQIIQFLTGFTLFFNYKDLPCFARSGPLMAVYYYTYGYVFIVLLFFLQFFVSSYLCKKAHKKKQM
mmetsp:Transcript_7415/g.18069  ORF Transcript_7415/g.18069 Transcript_7415/m.18069 type:complete len:258 (-) Transcript_7415:244-1017(-)